MNRRTLLRAITSGACAPLMLSSELALAHEFSAAPDNVRGDLQHLRNACWETRRAFQYMQNFGEVKGCNYVPSDGSNVMNSPNDELIRPELGWARDVAGLNSVRVWVQLADFQVDPNRLYANFEKFLHVCDRNQIKVLPVLSLESVLDPDVSPTTAGADHPTMDFHPSVHGGLEIRQSNPLALLQPGGPYSCKGYRCLGTD